MAPSLIPCPGCGCHAKSTEASCPSCGAPLRGGDGSIPRTAVAVLLGLSAAGAIAGACSSSTSTLVPDYGIAVTTSSATGSGGSGTGGSGTGGGDAGESTSDGGTGG